MSDAEDAMSMREHAGSARKARERRNERVSELGAERSSLIRPGKYSDKIADPERYGELGTEIKAEEEQYATASKMTAAAHPLLAAFAESGNTSALALIESGSTEQVARFLGQEIERILQNIETVRAARAEGDVNVWRLPRLLQRTQEAYGYGPGTGQAAMVAAKVDEVKTDEAVWNATVGLLSLALALALSVETGGGSLAVYAKGTAAVGAASLSTYAAYDNYNKYVFESAAAGTDFSKAKALSADDPSLFWLALDIVGVVADVGAAARLFRSMRSAARVGELATGSSTAFEKLVSEVNASSLDEAAKGVLVGKLKKHRELLSGVGERVKEIRAKGVAEQTMMRVSLKSTIPFGTEAGQLLLVAFRMLREGAVELGAFTKRLEIEGLLDEAALKDAKLGERLQPYVDLANEMGEANSAARLAAVMERAETEADLAALAKAAKEAGFDAKAVDEAAEAAVGGRRVQQSDGVSVRAAADSVRKEQFEGTAGARDASGIGARGAKDRPASVVTEEIPGLYEAMRKDLSRSPGWKKAHVAMGIDEKRAKGFMSRVKGGGNRRRIEVTIVDHQGARIDIAVRWDAKKGRFEMLEAFADPRLERRIPPSSTGGLALSERGTPTFHFGVMRGMHAASVKPGSIQLIHSDNIQNVEVLAQLKYLREMKPDASIDDLLAEIPFFSPSRPDIVQSGHQVVGSPRMKPHSNPDDFTFGELIDHQVGNLPVEAQDLERLRLEEILKKYGRNRDEMAGSGFDVEQDLHPAG